MFLLVEFDENGFREDGTQFGEIFSAENIVSTNDSFNTAESFSTLGESFSQANESFVTAVDYAEAPEENFDSENGEFRVSIYCTPYFSVKIFQCVDIFL